jgi:tetratricopeptide (TPR) repeat protein
VIAGPGGRRIALGFNLAVRMAYFTSSFQRGGLLVLLFPFGLSLAAQDATQLLASGDSLMALNKPQRALEKFEAALKQEQSPRTYLARARAFQKLQRMDRFLLDVEKVLRMDSLSAEAHFLRAQYAAKANDAERVELHASHAIRLGSDGDMRREARLMRGMARAELNEAAGAIEDLEAVMAAGHEEIEVLKAAARMYDAAGRHADALDLLERLCDLEPGQMGHWVNRAFELTQLGRFDEAMPMIEKALEYDPDEPVALSNRAYIRYKTGKRQEARTDVERSLRSFPMNPYALRTRALIRIDDGDRKRACEDLSLARAIGGVAEVEQLVQEHCSGR